MWCASSTKSAPSSTSPASPSARWPSEGGGACYVRRACCLQPAAHCQRSPATHAARAAVGAAGTARRRVLLLPPQIQLPPAMPFRRATCPGLSCTCGLDFGMPEPSLLCVPALCSACSRPCSPALRFPRLRLSTCLPALHTSPVSDFRARLHCFPAPFLIAGAPFASVGQPQFFCEVSSASVR